MIIDRERLQIVRRDHSRVIAVFLVDPCTEICQTDRGAVDQDVQNSSVPVEGAETDLRHFSAVEVMVAALRDHLPQQVVQLVLVPDVIPIHQLRIHLHEFHSGEGDILIGV